MNKLILSLTAAIMLSACSSSEERLAESLYTRAEQAYQAKEWGQARILLDSIESECRTAISWRKAGHLLNYKAMLGQQEDSLATADTMLLAITPLINEMIEQGKFVYEKGEYDELGRYYVKGTDAQSNLGRCYVHATTDEYGEISLISEYRGGSYIDHTQLRLTSSDQSTMCTAVVPTTMEGANYHFKNQGVCHETVTYRNDSAIVFFDLFANDSKAKAALLYHDGTKSYPIQLADSDRRAIALTYQLSKMLAAQLRYTQQSKVAAGKVQFLRTKIGTAEQGSIDN